MKKTAIIIFLCVVIPSIALGWLALRTLKDQQFLLEKKYAEIYQKETDRVVGEIEREVARLQSEFRQKTKRYPLEYPHQYAMFNPFLLKEWPMAEVGFVIDFSQNEIVSPTNDQGASARDFIAQNLAFLTNVETGEFFAPQSIQEKRIEKRSQKSYSLEEEAAAPASASASRAYEDELRVAEPENTLEGSSSKLRSRSVSPQQNFNLKKIAPISTIVGLEGEFRQAIGKQEEGIIARFLQNELHLWIWHRRDVILGAQIDLDQLTSNISPFLNGDNREIVLGLIDDKGKPVATSSKKGFTADWKRPFVSTEIGEILPHWEVAAYLINPGVLNQSAQTFRISFGLMVLLLVLAIAMGGFLIFRDTQRQVILARQKSDFVSNVSHELKTPLTSIQMFTELLQGDSAIAPEKQKSYIQIIGSEAARLSRLINNVLDFAKIERSEKQYRFDTVALEPLIEELVEKYRPHLEAHGYQIQWRSKIEGAFIEGDRDALSQVIVNLISNAEKYGGHAKEIEIVLDKPGDHLHIDVCDRGPGVPREKENQIFEKFYRAEDSLASGIQGSGLGLTLARQIVRDHSGDLLCIPREGGGSIFRIILPQLTPTQS